jgi:hypothetical protein
MKSVRDNPELLVLSAMVHGRTQAGKAMARLLPVALTGLESETARRYARMMVSSLGEEARQALEEMMRSNSQQEKDFFQVFVDEGIQKGLAKGVLQGKAAAVLVVLRSRGLEVDAQSRELIISCEHIALIEQWLSKAATVQSVQELLEPDPEFLLGFVGEGPEQGLTEGMARGLAKGFVDSRVADVLEVLDARGFKVDAQSRERVVACTDFQQLKLWLRKAVTVHSVQELFDP